MKIYQERLSQFQGLLNKNRKTDRLYSLARFVVMAAVLLSLYFSINREDFSFLYVAGILLCLFIFLLFRHKDVRDRSKRYRSFIRANQNELDYHRGELGAFRNGTEYLDRDHLYSYDLDLFGSRSVFQHVNRTVTKKGEILLAKEFMQPEISNILQKQNAVKELGADIEFRQQFLVEAGLIEEDPDLEAKINRWNSQEAGASVITNKWILWFFSALALGGMIYWMSFPSLSTFYVFLALGGLNLAIVGTRLKKIRSEYLHLNGVSKSLLLYGNLLALIEKRSHESGLLKDQSDRLNTSSTSAGIALKKLSRILNGFDQLNNVVGALIMNALFLYHLHTLRDLRHWKSRYGSKIQTWMEVTAHFDQLCSLGNFTFNHPDYIFPSVTAEPAFRATDMGHPLLREENRVDNSIDFDSFRYVILTGSNMSGKSTFLKTIGVNLVLAKMGASVCAAKMEFYPFRLLTSMKMVDSIEREESYFQAEVGRLKRIKDAVEEERPCFVLLDEILRGTNSDDKRKGTRLFMQRIAESNSLGVVATHDIDIADLAMARPAVFAARYFESQFESGSLHFDYRLREGVCTTPNATELMRSRGII